jgi:hypothetical protein
MSAAQLPQNDTKLQIDDIWQSTCPDPAQQRTAANTTTRRSCVCQTAVCRQLLCTGSGAHVLGCRSWVNSLPVEHKPAGFQLRTCSCGHAGHAVQMLNKLQRLINTVSFTGLLMVPEHAAQHSAHAGVFDCAATMLPDTSTCVLHITDSKPICCCCCAYASALLVLNIALIQAMHADIQQQPNTAHRSAASPHSCLLNGLLVTVSLHYLQQCTTDATQTPCDDETGLQDSCINSGAAVRCCTAPYAPFPALYATSL